MNYFDKKKKKKRRHSVWDDDDNTARDVFAIGAGVALLGIGLSALKNN